jgi:TonB family protein
MPAFRKWIAENYEYPEAAFDAEVKGTVIISFVVEKDGSLSDFKIDQDLGHGTGDNALSLLRKSPAWKSAMKDGKQVRVRYALPIQLGTMMTFQ